PGSLSPRHRCHVDNPTVSPGSHLRRDRATKTECRAQIQLQNTPKTVVIDGLDLKLIASAANIVDQNVWWAESLLCCVDQRSLCAVLAKIAEDILHSLGPRGQFSERTFHLLW